MLILVNIRWVSITVCYNIDMRGYRRNSDRDIRALERQALQGDFEAFLKYRAALARKGHCDQLQLKKGAYLIGFHGRLEYVKTSGRINTVTLACDYQKKGDRWEAFLRGDDRGKGFRQSTEHLIRNSILVPQELAGYMESLREKLYWDTVDPEGRRLQETRFEQEWWKAETPRHQEHMYKTLVQVLDDLGYCQQHYLEDVYCEKGCGRLLGLATPQRSLKSMCLYCWKDAVGLDDAWLEEQLERSGGHPAAQN
jgi:hypothetical protein